MVTFSVSKIFMIALNRNKRTNGPVNADLIAEQIISTIPEEFIVKAFIVDI